jgi:phosphohistidine phosphatase
MKTLTLLRHAKSSWNNPGLGDHERPLNPRGERDAPEMARRINEAGIRPSLIVSSPATRAWNTAKFLANEISYPNEFLQRDNKLYGASLDTLIRYLASQDSGFNSILMVGHNPGLTDFANYLVPDVTNNLPTAGVLSVQIDSDDWDLRDAKSITLELFDYPKRVSTPRR